MKNFLKSNLSAILIGILLIGNGAAFALNAGYALMDSNGNVLDGSGMTVGLPDAYSSLWYYDGTSTTTISTTKIFTQITDFVNVGEEDANSNVVGDPTTDDDLVIGASGAGVYNIDFQSSFRNASGSNKDMLMIPGITLATPIAITSSTDATPIVVTTTSPHGLDDGDMVTISGHGTNVAANTDSRITVTGASTFSMEDLDGASVAGSGSGAGSGGNIDIVYPGNLALRRIVSGTDLGRGAGKGTYDLAVSDIVELYVANLADANNLVGVHYQLGLQRIE